MSEPTQPAPPAEQLKSLTSQQDDGLDIVFPAIDLQREPSEMTYGHGPDGDEYSSNGRGGRRIHHPTRPDTAAGLEAIALVDAEMDRLPCESELDYSELLAPEGFSSQNQQFFKRKRIPDDLPRGHPECLRGKSFVMSGFLPNLTHVIAEEIIRAHGGRVVSSIGRSTTFLLVGQNAMRSKCDKVSG